MKKRLIDSLADIFAPYTLLEDQQRAAQEKRESKRQANKSKKS